ncbi:MAG: hypothetical protein A3G81_18715 [Betaproteobacteria bacterium RIFCSPLOWO2_12_FULL_65_14]|nr:MAG: hypothetical protein A3G81_18715 [Betaproteobacteria bacterium RIFCSPLOWO2_12_FULL_65_14]
MRACTIAAAAVALLAAGAASAQLYRWTDPSGRVHFTDTPPPPNARNVQKKQIAPAPSQPSKPAEPYVLQQARRNAPVTLYTGPGCDPCAAARKLLNDRGVPFKEVSVADEASASALQKAVGGGIVPAIIVGERSQMGFEQGTYHGLLDAAGYPKTGILPAQKPKAAAATPVSTRVPPRSAR